MTIVYDKLMALHLEPVVQVYDARRIALRCARTRGAAEHRRGRLKVLLPIAVIIS